ncbi:MAG: ATP synthase F1 subunit delta [Candidatus Marinimicrobia bacterium]|nr:ATP synthase F1 subunit delta [Candidatus Neomarinimicrobiota bacterium]
MAISNQGRRFAKAVFAVAEMMDAEEVFIERFSALAVLFRRNRAFRHLLITRRISVDDKMKAIKKVLGDQLGDLELESLRALLEQRLGSELPFVARVLEQQGRASDLREELTVYSVAELSDSELSEMADKISDHLRKPVRASGIVDEGLIGGLKLRLGNTLIDGSIARRLEQISSELL